MRVSYSFGVRVNFIFLQEYQKVGIIMGEKLWRIEIAYFLSSCLWDLKIQGVQKTPPRKTPPRQILPQKVPPCQFPPEENSSMENSPVSFSQVIFVERMFLFLKTDFFIYKGD